MVMRSRATVVALVLAALTLPLINGCATIVHGGPRFIPVNSTPEGAIVTIYNREGMEVSKQTTPFVATLTTKYKYFSGQSYRLVFEMPGYKSSEVQLQPRTSGWFFANLVFGGVIGMLIVDPITGAMYNLTPDKVEQSLPAATAAQMRRGETIVVIMKSQATSGEIAAMEAVVSPRG